MGTDIKTVLNNINDLGDLNHFIESVSSKEIGIWGGRKFILKTKKFGETLDVEGELSLNEIIRKFDSLTRKNLEPDIAIEIRQRIRILDKESGIKLLEASLPSRFFTLIKSIFGDKPREPSLFSNPSRKKVLTDIGYRIKDEKKKSQYLAEEYFDQMNISSNEGDKTHQLKKAISDVCIQPSLENKNQLITSVHEFFQDDSKEKTQTFFRLVYIFRNHDLKTLRSELPPLLIVGYAKAKKWEGDFGAPQHPIRTIHVYYAGEEWSLYEDSDLVSRAQALYQA
jgi:hypothetical protein